ncbi:MAG: cytochrome b [Pseudomonadota bacterium]|nr:cytochrome b [Pseudomonadota bacterium]
MLFKNTSSRFGIIAILLHWTMAILIIGLLALGIYMTRIPVSMHKLQYYGWHKEFGILALMLAVVRITWRLSNPLPTHASLSRMESIAAHTVHWAFYFFMFALPLTGWLLTSTAGLPVGVFSWFVLPNLLADNENQRLLFTEIHSWLGWGLLATFCLHTTAALKHYFLNKDDILQRMIRP